MPLSPKGGFLFYVINCVLLFIFCCALLCVINSIELNAPLSIILHV
jgi:hypothetical protein